MPIIPIVGRKSVGIKVLIVGIYTILIFGSITMLYPFILMVSTSFTSYMDMHEFRPIPRYFYNDEVLFKKHIEAKYNEDTLVFNKLLNQDILKFDELKFPKRFNKQVVDDWMKFFDTLPINYKMLGFQQSFSKTTPEIIYRYRKFLEKKFDNSIEKLNSTYKERQRNWADLTRSGFMPFDLWYQKYQPNENLKYKEFIEFRNNQPKRFFIPVCIDGFYRYNLFTKYGKDISLYNKAHGTNYKSYFEVTLKEKLPSNKLEAEDWINFVRNELPFQFIRLEKGTEKSFQKFLEKKYNDIGGIKSLNEDYNKNYKSFREIPLPEEILKEGFEFTHYREFIEKEVSSNYIILSTVEIGYRKHLKELYSDMEKLNDVYGKSYSSFEEFLPPVFESEFVMFKKDKNTIKMNFIWKNYREVIDYIILHGRALINTIILCIGIILITLIVNPLCAYALSRFNLKATYKILLFLLATMSFPAEVSAIPSFLIIKKLGLLNTYWAIILPGMANGFSIFLLKGFFDSLPKEYYDACLIDGATEMNVFWHITLPLSKPILAVITLGAFTAAYGSFMWAFLVCQDDKMWTLMVWLYQLQSFSPQYVVFAGLVISAIPTLLVFIFCQRIIMRGVILPVET